MSISAGNANETLVIESLRWPEKQLLILYFSPSLFRWVMSLVFAAVLIETSMELVLYWFRLTCP
jgi:hypothetical protein